MRVTLASSTYIRHATSSGTSSAHATAALIGLTWVTTTTVPSDAASETSTHAARTLLPSVHQRLATRRRVGRIRSPPLPDLLRDVRWRPAVELAVVELDPPCVELDGHAERLGGVACPLQRARDHERGSWQGGREPARLLAAGVRERGVAAAQEHSPYVLGRLAVTHDQEHRPILRIAGSGQCRPIRDQARVSAPRPDPGGPQTESLGAGIFRRGHESDDTQ